MILKTIACEGKVLEPWMLMDEIDVVDLESGIKKSGTFHFICRECDALYFQDYENKEALLNDPTDKMFAEIALKRHSPCKTSRFAGRIYYILWWLVTCCASAPRTAAHTSAR